MVLCSQKAVEATAAHCADIHLLGTAQLTSAGTASLKFRPGIGSHSYKSVFLNTTRVTGSQSSAESLAVTGQFPTTTSIGQSGGTGNYTLTATVTGRGSPVAPSGSVSFVDTSNNNAAFANAALGNATLGLVLTNPQTPVAGNLSSSAATGDFNGDGIPDVAIANYGASSLTVF